MTIHPVNNTRKGEEMNEEQENKKSILINDHWAYVEGLLTHLNVDDDLLLLLHYVYKTAAVHFYGHGYEDATNNIVERREK